MKKPSFIQNFNWRASLMRVLINAAALAVIALLLPNIYFVQLTIWNILFVSIALGVLNAVIKPILQFLTLSFIFTTYGLVVVLINAIILWLLAFLFPDRFAVDSVLAALIGGALVGILGSFFESLLGLSPPIVSDEQAGLRKQAGDQTQVVTKMILKTDQEEVGLADPAEPLPANQQDDVSADEEESGLNPAQEREVEEGKQVMEEETMSVDEDLENADTLDEAAEQAAETGDDNPNETLAQKQENESWQ